MCGDSGGGICETLAACEPIICAIIDSSIIIIISRGPHALIDAGGRASGDVCCALRACSQRYDEACRARSCAQQRWPSPRRAVPPFSWPRCVALAVAERTAMKDPAPRVMPTGRARSRATSFTCCGWAEPSTRSAVNTYSLARRVGTLRARAAHCHCTAQAPSLRVAVAGRPSTRASAAAYSCRRTSRWAECARRSSVLAVAATSAVRAHAPSNPRGPATRL